MKGFRMRPHVKLAVLNSRKIFGKKKSQTRVVSYSLRKLTTAFGKIRLRKRKTSRMLRKIAPRKGRVESLAPELWIRIIELLRGVTHEDVMKVGLTFPKQSEHVFRRTQEESREDIGNLALSNKFFALLVSQVRRNFPQGILESPIECWSLYPEVIREFRVTKIQKWVLEAGSFTPEHLDILKFVLKSSETLVHLLATFLISPRNYRKTILPLRRVILETLDARRDQLKTVHWYCQCVEVLLSLREKTNLSSLAVHATPCYSSEDVKQANEKPRRWDKLRELYLLELDGPKEGETNNFEPSFRILTSDIFPVVHFLWIAFTRIRDFDSALHLVQRCPAVETLVLESVGGHSKLESEVRLPSLNGLTTLGIDFTILYVLGFHFAPHVNKVVLLGFDADDTIKSSEQVGVQRLFDALSFIGQRKPVTLRVIQVQHLSILDVKSRTWNKAVKIRGERLLKELSALDVKVLDEGGAELLFRHFLFKSNVRFLGMKP